LSVDAIGHVGAVHHSEFGVVVSAKGGLVFEKSKGSKGGGDGDEGERVESVEDAGGASVLEHPRRCNQFGKWPSDDGKHGEAAMSEFGFLHGELIELLGESQWIKSKISRYGSVELWRSLQEGKGLGVFFIRASAAARYIKTRFCSTNSSIPIQRVDEEKCELAKHSNKRGMQFGAIDQSSPTNIPTTTTLEKFETSHQRGKKGLCYMQLTEQFCSCQLS
jgi:hypothetical protein